ncbi:hypothetical protein EDD16DRAFT_1516021 [Pisolithus croceorrhizus]|nr:hypothetical protein EV401DRAFT_1890589 [Pisolithus croceorrhizus]KAI6128925.1 hypothetical protein EDD16DRAFT_1516021 [Pisolithus croceorrhizus]
MACIWSNHVHIPPTYGLARRRHLSGREFRLLSIAASGNNNNMPFAFHFTLEMLTGGDQFKGELATNLLLQRQTVRPSTSRSNTRSVTAPPLEPMCIRNYVRSQDDIVWVARAIVGWQHPGLCASQYIMPLASNVSAGKRRCESPSGFIGLAEPTLPAKIGWHYRCLRKMACIGIGDIHLSEVWSRFPWSSLYTVLDSACDQSQWITITPESAPKVDNAASSEANPSCAPGHCTAGSPRSVVIATVVLTQSG